MKNRNLLIILPLLFAPAMAMAHPWFIRERGTRVCVNVLSLPTAHERAIMRTPESFAAYQLRAYGNHTQVDLSRLASPRPSDILVTVVTGNRRVHVPQIYDYVDFFSSKKICQEMAKSESSYIVNPTH